MTRIYKILCEVLANRLGEVVGSIMSKLQNTFVKGTQILNSVFIANECLDSKLKSGTVGILCKLDMEKACDHVNWDFLIYLLGRCDLGGRWCKWIS